MKKILLLSLSILSMVFSLYAITVMLIFTVTSGQSVTAGIIVPIVLLVLILFGIFLLGYCYRHFRFGKYNVDILTTIYLFLVFMFAYTVPNSIITNYLGAEHFFPLISSFITVMATKSIGIYEATLFMATIFCGLTIGEDKNKKYYE